MAVNTALLASFNPDSYGYVTAGQKLGKQRMLVGSVTVPASVDAGSIASIPGRWARVPWGAILVPGASLIANTALGASLTVALGIAKADPAQGLGTVQSNNALMAATDFSAAGTRTILDTIAKWGAAGFGAPLWKLAGLTSAPNDCPPWPDFQFLTAGATSPGTAQTIGFSLAFLLPEG